MSRLYSKLEKQHVVDYYNQDSGCSIISQRLGISECQGGSTSEPVSRIWR